MVTYINNKFACTMRLHWPVEGRDSTSACLDQPRKGQVVGRKAERVCGEVSPRLARVPLSPFSLLPSLASVHTLSLFSHTLQLTLIPHKMRFALTAAVAASVASLVSAQVSPETFRS